jgi:hypothetical protein
MSENFFKETLLKAGAFFESEGGVWEAARSLTEAFDAERLDYALAGSVALASYGFRQYTGEELQIVVAASDLERATQLTHDAPLTIRCYTAPNVPAPRRFSVIIDHCRVLTLASLLELLIVRGRAPHRMRDLADAQRVIGTSGVAQSFAATLGAGVRNEFEWLWQLAHTPDPLGQGS